jgi:hypothetical protein
MEIEPLSKEIYNKAIELKIKEIRLEFSGGNDEGNLYVSTLPSVNFEFENEIESWAWDAYSYSGAGDGNDYGDTITYDLVNKKATASEWYTARQEGESAEIEMPVETESDSE